jgi:hypothetical protein
VSGEKAVLAHRARRERNEFCSRLAGLPGVEIIPAIGDWVLLRVAWPSELARRVARLSEPGLVTTPRWVKGVVKVQISDPATNARTLTALRDCLRELRGAIYLWGRGSLSL